MMMMMMVMMMKNHDGNFRQPAGEMDDIPNLIKGKTHVPGPHNSSWPQMFIYSVVPNFVT